MEPLYVFTNEVIRVQARVMPRDDGRYDVELVDLRSNRRIVPTPVIRDLSEAVEHAGNVACAAYENGGSVACAARS